MKRNTRFLLFLIVIGFIIYTCRSKPQSTTIIVTNTKDDKQTEKTNSLEATPKKSVSDPTIICNDPNFDLITQIRASAIKWTGTKYNNAKGTDCSGIFHKVINDLRNDCPSALFPNFNVDRSSRDIAAWYHANGDLRIIRNPEQNGHLIQPGVVMFYGKAGKSYNLETMDMESLKNAGGINHVAIVTDVIKDEHNKIISYDIFHGLNPRKHAQITTSYLRDRNNPNLHAYSNWNEPWLAVANILVSNNNRTLL